MIWLCNRRGLRELISLAEVLIYDELRVRLLSFFRVWMSSAIARSSGTI
jgi:hypothetical protein